MAKKVEYSVEERLRALYDLQLVDSRIDKLRSVRGELPLEVKDLEDEVSGLDVRISKIQSELDGFQNEIKEKLNKIEESKALIKKYNDLKSEKLEMKNKIDLLKHNNEKIIGDLKNSKLSYQSLKIGKILESDNKQFVKKRIDKMIQDLDFCITNLSS